MCIICAKGKGIAMPEEKTIKTMWINNSDGAGIMWVENGVVNIRKGFMECKDFEDFLKSLSERLNMTETPIVMHFRIETHGGVKPENCHPFPISDNVANLQKLEFKTTVGVAHNGIISSVTPRTGISDTMEYIASHLAYMRKIDKKFYRKEPWRKLVYQDITSKMAFLDSTGNIYTVGDFINEDGILYSCSSYKPHIYNYERFNSSKYYQNYAWGYGAYDEWDVDNYLLPANAEEDNKFYYSDMLMCLPPSVMVVDDNTGEAIEGQLYMDDVKYLYKRDDENDVVVPLWDISYSFVDLEEEDYVPKYDYDKAELQIICDDIIDIETPSGVGASVLYQMLIKFSTINITDEENTLIASAKNAKLGDFLKNIQFIIGKIDNYGVYDYSSGERNYWAEAEDGNIYFIECIAH